MYCLRTSVLYLDSANLSLSIVESLAWLSSWLKPFVMSELFRLGERSRLSVRYMLETYRGVMVN